MIFSTRNACKNGLIIPFVFFVQGLYYKLPLHASSVFVLTCVNPFGYLFINLLPWEWPTEKINRSYFSYKACCLSTFAFFYKFDWNFWIIYKKKLKFANGLYSIFRQIFIYFKIKELRSDMFLNLLNEINMRAKLFSLFALCSYIAFRFNITVTSFKNHCNVSTYNLFYKLSSKRSRIQLSHFNTLQLSSFKNY